MRKTLLLGALLSLVGSAIAAEAVTAKGAGSMPAPGGVTVPDSAYRYIAISPGHPGRLTVVAQVERRDGRLTRWWRLPGSYQVPAVAYDITAGGLSADGETLVLSRFTRQFPPRRTRFAIVDTGRTHRPPRVPGSKRQRRDRPFVFADLRGDFSFDAISPDGSTVYLIQRFPENKGPDYLTTYEVRAYDVESGRLLPQPIVDPREPNERMEGLPLTRATSPDGRWAYTLYDGNGGEPFVHALDTVGRSAVCIDLPQLEKLPERFFYLLRMRLSADGGELVVRRLRPGPPPSRELLTVDTASFEVERTHPREAGLGGGPPWLAIGIAGALLAAGLTRLGRGRRGAPADGGSERV